MWVDIFEVSSKFVRQNKFSASVSSCFLLDFFSAGTKFKSVKVSKEHEFSFDQFITLPNASDLYLILLLIVRCMPVMFPFFVE